MSTSNSNKMADMPNDTDFTEEEMAQLSDEEADEEEADEEADEEEAPAEEEPVSLSKAVESKGDGFTPQLDETGVEDYDEKVDVLTKQYEDGDIGLGEYTKQTGLLAAQQATADANKASNELMSEQRWEADKNAFFELNPMFKEADNPDMYDALDAKLRRMSTAGELDGMSASKALVTAANAVLNVRQPQQEEPASAENKRPRPKKGDVKIPTGLADVPSADSNSTGKNKFANIDNLEGEALENAVAAMSDADRTLYEQML